MDGYGVLILKLCFRSIPGQHLPFRTGSLLSTTTVVLLQKTRKRDFAFHGRETCPLDRTFRVSSLHDMCVFICLCLYAVGDCALMHIQYLCFTSVYMSPFRLRVRGTRIYNDQYVFFS